MDNGKSFMVRNHRATFWLPLAGVLTALLVWLVELGYHLPWTGFGGGESVDIQQPAKTLWDWLELLIIPIFISLGVVLITSLDRKQDTRIALDRLRESAIQSYLDAMTKLITEQDLCTAPRSEVRELARARTIAVLETLDGRRRGIVIKFLCDLGLISGGQPTISLVGANLEEIDLRWSILPAINLREAYMKNADLEHARLEGADFREAYLESANFNHAVLKFVFFQEAYLENANFTNADVNDSDFSKAYLKGARPAKLFPN